MDQQVLLVPDQNGRVEVVGQVELRVLALDPKAFDELAKAGVMVLDRAPASREQFELDLASPNLSKTAHG